MANTTVANVVNEFMAKSNQPDATAPDIAAVTVLVSVVALPELSASVVFVAIAELKSDVAELKVTVGKLADMMQQLLKEFGEMKNRLNPTRYARNG